MQTAAVAPASVAAASTEAVEAERKGARYVTVWVPLEKMEPVTTLAAGEKGTLRFTNRVSAAE